MGKAVEKKRKKKGRPSLLDLQKRSLRLQKQQEQQQEQQKRNLNPNPNNTNPYARFPNPVAGRRTTRRNSNPEPDPPSPEDDGGDAAAAASWEDDDDEDEPSERRKEKKLKLVLHLPHPNANSSDLASSASESDGTAHKKRRINAVGKLENKNSSWKATDASQGETSDLGPTTPLPDKKLLEFILDRLQKKDTYGVFSEPVDPDELPDYHDIIEHPMDFGTVRKRLSSGAYKYLEQFEKDVFLISSNGMHYNAPDTIYFRQARSIHELSKKSFENLRQESEDSEPDPKVARRGRPPGTGKNNVKRPVGRPPAERAGSEFSSEASLANVVNGNHLSSRNDLLRKGPGLHSHGVADASVRTKFVHSADACSLGCELRSERTQNYSGSAWKGSSKYAKNLSVVDENRRNTYKQYQLSSSAMEFPVLTALDEDRKILVPVGLHAEYAYARSLARFAANLGPICWKIAALRIEKVLPPGTKFGPGWVGESDPQPSQHPLFSTPSVHPSTLQTNLATSSRSDQFLESQEELPINIPVGQESCVRTSLPSSSISVPAVVVASDRFPTFSEVKVSSQLQQNAMMQPHVNGFKVPFTTNLPQPGQFGGLDGPPGNFGLEAVVAQAQAFNIVLSNSSSCSFGSQWSGTFPPDAERVLKVAGSSGPITNHGIPLPISSEGRLPVHNVRLQSSGSPIPGVAVDSQQPDLALQL